MSLAQTISEATQGNKQAQQFVYEKFSVFSMILCLRYLKHKEEAEEAMLDGFLKFFRGLENFRYKSEAGLSAYIKKIMVNECLVRLRRKNVLTLLPETEIPDIAIKEDVVGRLDMLELYKMILYLPDVYRTVFNMHALEGYDHKEIARQLNITENASRARLLRARGLLQKMLTIKEKLYEEADK